MNKIEDEILYRRSLLNDARQGKKLTADEREWLASNRAYSSRYGYPYLSMDILKLLPDTQYSITVRLLSSYGEHILTPTFSVPLGKGCISWVEPYGSIKEAKMLSTANTEAAPIFYLSFQSSGGLLAVTYHYKAHDHRGTEYWQSSTVDDRLAMLRTQVSENEVIYSCTDIDDDRYDKYIFSARWERS